MYGRAALNRLTLGDSAAPAEEPETFSLVSAGGDPPAFSMIIRLSPAMVEEIKRVEAQGGKARIKFDSNPNNRGGGNIIEVGGKEFRFTWSREFGDLWDIYEERQSGEDGNGLLVESGCAWRKLNVQRVLDESTKNHVKMRSVEAERKLKSRKAIVLEPGNPSMKALAAVEVTLRNNYNKIKEPASKKRKVETLQVGGSPKSTYKPGLSSTTATKGRHSSPFSSPPDQPATLSSPLGAVNISKSIDDVVPSQMNSKQDPSAGPEKKIPARAYNAMRDTPGGDGNNIAKPIDLQSILISLLMNKPSGLTLKALEKAVHPNSIKKIEPIVRKIARYKAPGRYILLPGVNMESFKKPQTESGSSHNDNHRKIAAHQEFRDHSAPEGGIKEKVPNDDLVELVQLNSKVEEESNTLEKLKVPHASPDMFSEKKGSYHSEGKGGSSSDSGSGSDSDSDSDSESDRSDSGGDTRSHGRNLAAAGSGSSSVSEKDASSKSEEGLDEDVDIMTSDDDEEEPKNKTEASDQRVSSIIPVKSLVFKSTHSISRVGFTEDTFNDPIVLVVNKGDRQRNSNVDFQKGYVQTFPGKSILHLPQTGQRSFDQTMLGKPSNPLQKSDKRGERLRCNRKHSEKNFHVSEMNCRFRSNESRVSQGVDLEGSSENNRRAPANASFKHDTKRGTVFYPVKESERQMPNSLEEVAGTGMDSGFADKNNSDQKRRESSSDESSCSYLKYEKDEPELKGPIRTFSQYKEYEQEFHDKYDSYSYLNKTLESYRNEFYNLGKELEYAKNRDVDKYYDILGKLKESYERYGMQHKRQKQIYVVLHLELEQLKRMITDFVDSYNKR